MSVSSAFKAAGLTPPLMSVLLSELFAFSEAAGEVAGAQSSPAKPSNSSPAILKWKRPGALPVARPRHIPLDHESLIRLAMLITP
jgi:hypothetical protein